jgi:hypothetical protein
MAVAVLVGLAACTRDGQSGAQQSKSTAWLAGNVTKSADPEKRCTGTATISVDGEPRRVRIEIVPCRSVSGEAPRAVLTNIGETQVGYGPGFKLERRIDGRWLWVNRRQAFTLPLFYLDPGEESEQERLTVYFDSPDPVELEPGLYRVTKSLQLTPGKPRPPTMGVRVKFHIVR